MTNVGAIEVGFRAVEIGLRAAAGEYALNKQLGSGNVAGGGIIVVAEEKAELVHPLGREDVTIADVDFVLGEAGGVPGLGKNEPADALIL